MKQNNNRYYLSTVGTELQKNTVGTEPPKNTVGTDPPKYTMGIIPPKNTMGTDTPKNTVGTNPPKKHVRDRATVPTVTKQPQNVKRKDWEHLSSFLLGTIVFASLKDPKAKSLPALIKKADLDGYRIFVLWDQNNLNCVGDMPLVGSICSEQGERYQFALELML